MSLAAPADKHFLRHGGGRDDDTLTILPGQVAVLLTEERVKIPDGVIGFISLKSTVKLPGLINVSGFHVDPGFEGHLTFTVFNAGTKAVTHHRGDKLFLLWLAEMDAGGDPYRGSHNGQDKIPSSVISELRQATTSPADLAIRVAALERTQKAVIYLFLPSLAAALVAALVLLPLQCRQSSVEPRQPTTRVVQTPP